MQPQMAAPLHEVGKAVNDQPCPRLLALHRKAGGSRCWADTPDWNGRLKARGLLRAHRHRRAHRVARDRMATSTQGCCPSNSATAAPRTGLFARPL